LKVHGRRSLLNGAGIQSTAAIVAEVEDTSTWHEGKNGKGDDLTTAWQARPDYTLSISDCYRTITIEMDMDTPAEWRNSIRKLNVMIDALTRMRDGVVEERARYVQRARGLSK
jgi:hypothetical protein